jgi:hypothetical protein
MGRGLQQNGLKTLRISPGARLPRKKGAHLAKELIRIKCATLVPIIGSG